MTAVGIYSSVGLGFLATIVAARGLGLHGFGDYSAVVVAAGFLQSFFDLTVEEALVKYGFRYSTRNDWGRLRRLFAGGLRLKVVGSLLAAIGLVVFSQVTAHRLEIPLLVAAPLPLLQSLEGFAGAMLYLRSRYDIRSVLLGWSMCLRLAGIAVGSRYGVVQTVAGLLIAQAISTATTGIAGGLAFRRFPRTEARPLSDERREIVSFVVQSSVATGVLALRGGLAPLLLGAVTNTTQLGLFRVAQAPQSGFQALSAPARMVLLTEQTRDWERGRQSDVLRSVRRYSLAALGLSLVLAPPLLIWIPDLIRWIYGEQFVAASNAARLFILAAAVQLVVGWSKSFPVTIGRPGLRIVTHGVETAIVLPLTVVFGAAWGAAGAAGAVLAGMCAFAAMWWVIFLRVEAVDTA